MSPNTPAAGPDAAARNARLLRLAGGASVAVASTLIAVKLMAWVATDSVSLLSTLVDSLIDVGASLVNLLAIRHALQPADREHRFGHGKAEPLAGLAQAAFITGSAGFLVAEAVKRFAHPREVANSDVGLVVMAFAVVATVALVLFQRHVVRRTGSVAIRADSLHYQTDVLVNAGVAAALLLGRELGWRLADPVFAIAIAGYILWSAWTIGVASYNLLMDHELPTDDRDRILAAARSHPGVRGAHDLRTRSSGQRVFVEIHLEMDGELTLWRAHAIAEEVQRAIEAVFPATEVIVHQDPAGVIEPRAGLD